MRYSAWCLPTVLLCAIASLVSCGPTPAPDGGEGEENAAINGGIGKGDTTVGRITSLSCTAQESFVEVGGFVEIDVDAIDEDGRESRNFTVQVTPETSARVVQRNKVIFDEAGAYDIRCLSNDSPHTDATSVMVGYREPALTVNARKFVDRDRVRITGRAVAAENAPLYVEIDGYITELADDGSFDATMPADVGEMNRFHVVATDSRGRTSDRNVYAVVGQFGDLQEPTPDAVRVGMGPDVYPQLASLVERVISGLPAGQTDRSDNLEFEDLLSTSTGENLGIQWEFDPQAVGSTPPNVTLTPASSGILVDVVFDEAYIDAIVRTGDPGDQRERDMRGDVDNLVVSATLQVNGPDDLGIRNVTTDWDSLDVDVADFPNWIIDLFVYFLEDNFKELIRDGIERAGNRALVGALEGFGVERQFDLPDPLVTTMTTSSAISTLAATEDGLDVGLSFGIDGETDPLRAEVPGPLRFEERSTRFDEHEAYQVAIALEPINDLFFAAWQTASLDLTFEFEEGIETAPEAPQITSVIAFADPQLPPVLVPTDTPGVFELEIGEVRIDAVFDTSVGMANVAAIVGASATIEIGSDGDGFSAALNIDDTHVDVLVAPFSLEREAIEAILEEFVLPALGADVASVAANFPIPEADLTGLGVGLETLAVEDVTITQSAPDAAMSVRANVVVR
jgi:hypothetical protein